MPERLAATRARLRVFDGSLRIDAPPPEGARIEAEVPLRGAVGTGYEAMADG